MKKRILSLSMTLVMVFAFVCSIHQTSGIDCAEARAKEPAENETVSNIRPGFTHFRSSMIDIFFSLPVTSEDCLMIGDSITEFGKWGEFFQDCRFKNRGIGGETTVGMREWFAPLARKKPNKIILLVGFNNFKSGITEQKVDNYLKDLDLFASSIPQETKGYIVSILPVNTEVASGSIHCSNAHFVKINRMIKFLCSEYKNIEYIHMYPELLDSAGRLAEEYTIDGVHLSLDGYMKYCSFLKGKI